MTTVTVLAGERTIGGTQIVVEDQGARLLFDCGLPFNPATDPFTYVGRRGRQSLSDLIRLGIVPFIPHLYRPELLTELPSGMEPALPHSSTECAVALSHSHLDHTHLAGCVDPAIPMYASPATSRIAPLLGELGASLAKLTRPPTAVPAGESFSVGAMRVRLLPVDHDVCGATGFLIETTDGVIAYSGDLRLHGRHPMHTLAFAEAVRQAGARLLILEGTRLAPPAESAGPIGYERAEAEVAPEVVRRLTEIPGHLGVILLTPENGERVEALAHDVGSAGRLLVLDLEGVAMATAALGRPLAAPHAVYLPTATRCALQNDSAQSVPSRLHAALDEAGRVITTAEIAAAPGDFLLRLDFTHFADLLDLQGGRRGGMIFSANGPPLGPFDPAWTHMEWWADRLGMQVIDVNSSGHASPHDLGLIAMHAGAPTVMSLHSRHPELMPVPPERLLLPKRGHPYDLAGLPAA